ncbi:hypothetical protein GOA99_18565 [Sinorhizobium meliloti]|nr:hypothetical protein [Sinorhizobium meliloti]
MRAWVFSDLHLEHSPKWPIPEIPKADVCICAGDICNKGLTRSISILGEIVSQHMPVVFVPGNHEFYKSSIVEGLQDAIQHVAKYPDVHLLHRAIIRLNGFKFIGATFWSDFQLFGPGGMAMVEAETRMNDYKLIKLSKKPYKRFSARQSQMLHLQDAMFIRTALEEVCDEPTIVVTHHAPSILSLPPEYIDDPVSPAYASRFEDHIIKHEPTLWVHGHVHSRSDYFIHRTRVVCNAHGYPDETQRSGFDPGLVLELEAAR